MKRLAFVALVLFAPTVTFASAFPRNLQLGSFGPDVAALQRVLNQDPTTAVAVTGPGSSGNETDYFGPATKQAVIRFQEKYEAQVLVPNGIRSGNGFVGASTRAVLEAMGAAPATSSSAEQPVQAVAPIVAAPSSDADLGDLAVYWQLQRQVAEEQHYSSAQIAAMRSQIALLAATTTDLKAAFLKAARPAVISDDTSLLGRMVAFVGSLIFPERAEAALGSPFGGTLLAAIPCDGGVWNLVITPHSPLYPVLLSYESGSELFLWHNIPYPLGIGLKGAYLPVPMAYCWIGIYPFPSEGMITPQVGSSLLPAF